MWNRFIDFFRTPIFVGNEEKTRRAKALNALQIYLTGAMTILGFVGVIFIFDEKRISSIVLIVGIIITLLGILLNRLGKIVQSSAIMLVTLWGLTIYLTSVSGGIRSPHIMLFISGTVIAGIIAGARGALFYAALSIITSFGLVLAELNGYEFQNIFPFPPVSIWIILLLNLSFIIIPLQVTFQSLADSATHAVASAERYRLITSVMSDYVFFTQFGADGSVDEQWVSGAFELITGYTSEEYFARGGWPAILHPDSKEQDAQDMERLQKNKKVFSQIRIICKNGSVRWVRSYAQPKWDETNNRLAGVYGAVQDITEQKRFETSLQQREAILEVVAHTANLFLKTTDWRTEIDPFLERLGRTMDVSHAYVFENHSLGNGEPGKSLRYEWSAPSIPSDLDDSFYINRPLNSPGLEVWYKLMKQGLPYIGDKENVSQSEMESLRKDGIMSLLDVPIFVDGKWWGIIGFDDVLSEREWSLAEVDSLKVAANAIGSAIQRQWADDALKFSEEKFSRAFHTTPVLMTIENADGQFIEVNNAFIEALGYTREEIIGHRASELNLVPIPEDRDMAIQIQNMTDTFKDVEIRIRRKSGEIAIVLMSVEYINVNETRYILTSALDISERKQVEAEREALIDELGKKNEELERFTYTVSHDLKSPLVTINGFVGYLEQDAASGNMERLKKDTQRIQEAVQKMQKLLSELLELSRIGRMMNASETVPFEMLVGEAMESVHGQLETRGVEIHVQPDLPSIYGDKQRLIEVLQNLLDNAAKYMGDQVDPRIEIGQDGEEDGKLIFFVKDNGMGIDPEHHERIFGLFNKLDAKSEGTGVGLALVKRIVEVHGGRIWVQSEASPQAVSPRRARGPNGGEVGKGSTFYFTLPVGPSS